jgi:Tol biopolymer transport system component
MNPDGTGLLRLTFTPGNNEVEPVVSPDGQKIAFRSDVGAGGFNIWVMGINGSGPTQLTTSGSDKNPTWSPDGTKIAFDTLRTGVTSTI